MTQKSLKIISSKKDTIQVIDIQCLIKWVRISSIYNMERVQGRAQGKGPRKTHCHFDQVQRPEEYQAPEIGEQQVVTFKTHSQKMDLNKQQEDELFQKVLHFIKEALSGRKLLLELKQVIYKRPSLGKVSSENKNEKLLSFKKMNFGSKICFDAQAVPKASQEEKENCNYRATRCNNKKISILIAQEDYSSSSSEDFFSDQIVSETVVRTIRSIQIPRLEMSLETISLIYDTPQPFLIILSLCIFIRYCISTRRKVKIQESSWVLCIATVIAYKLYYDEQIEGLVDCFSGIMKIQRQDLIDLERCFLEEIDYSTVVRNCEYHLVMSKLLSMSAS